MNIALFGATGNLGNCIIRKAMAEGHSVTAFVRSPSKLRTSPTRIIKGSVSDSRAVMECCRSADIVISCLGASLSLNPFKSWTTYHNVDFKKNLHILEQSIKAGVEKFAYISVYSNSSLAKLKYVTSHRDFENALKNSGLKYLIFRPVGFFTSFRPIFSMARFGVVPLIGSGNSRTNPLSEDDLAGLCIDALDREDMEFDLGGRQVLSRAAMVREFFALRGVQGTIIPIPVLIVYLMLPFYYLLNPRFGSLIRFFAVASTHEAVAPEVCSTTIGEYFTAAS